MKKIKIIFITILFYVFILPGVYPDQLEQHLVKFYVAGKQVVLDSWHDEERSIFLVCVDDPSIAELVRALGGELAYDKKKKILTITKDIDTVKIFMDSFQYEWKGKKEDMPYPPQFIEGKPYMPFEVLPKILSAKAVYDEENKLYFFDPLITNIKLEEKEGKFYLDISATGPIDSKFFIVRQPERFVIDIPDAILVGEEKEIQNEKIGTIYYSQNTAKPNKVRIVVPQDTGAEVQAQSRKILNHIVFTITVAQSVSNVENFTTQDIDQIDVKTFDDSVKIFISSTGPIQYSWHRLKDPDNRFFVDIPLSILKSEKKEFQVESKFIEKVKIAQFQLEPQPTVRVVLYLKLPVEVFCIASGDVPNQLVLKATSSEIDPLKVSYTGTGVTSFSAKGKIICIDPGHGGSDTGAINRKLGVFEKDITLDISLRLSKLLIASGWNVILTRRTDRDVTYPGSSAQEELGARANLANNMKADIFLSIHINAMWSPQYNGISTHWYKNNDYLLAKTIQPVLIEKLKRQNKSIIKNRFYVLRVAKMPAALLELLFISNQEECKLLIDENFRQKIAEAIAEGLRAYLAVTNKGD